MAKIVEIAELKIDNKNLVKNLSDSRQQIQVLLETKKRLLAAENKDYEAITRNEAALKQVRAEYNNGVKVLNTVTNATERVNEALNTEAQSVAEALKQNKYLYAAKKQVNTSTEEGRRQVNLINDKINKNTKYITSNGSAMEKLKANIGNYSSGLIGTNNLLSNMIDILIPVKDALVAKNAAMKASAASTGLASTALRLFKIALASTGIGLLIVGLGSLVAYLKTTQSGIDAVTAVTRPLQAVFESLLGVTQRVGGALFKAFVKGDVKGAISDISNEVSGFGKNMTDAVEKGRQLDQLTKELEKGQINFNLQIAEQKKIIAENEQILKDVTKADKERLAAANAGIEATKRVQQIEQEALKERIRILKIEQTLNDTSREGEKELADLKAELLNKETQAAKTLTRLEVQKNNVIKQSQAKRDKAAAEALKLEEEEARRVADEKILIAKNELNEYIRNNSHKLNNERYFSNEALKIEKERLEGIAEARREFEKTKLEEGKINQIQYNEAISQIDFEHQAKIDEADNKRKEAKKVAEAIDLQNKIELDEANYTNKYELENERLEAERERELNDAEIKGANKSLIEEKYANISAERERLLAEQKVSITAKTFGLIAQLLGENTKAGKFAASAQAAINSFLGFTQVLAAPSTLPEPYGSIQKGINAASILSSGLATVIKINSVKTPKAEKGMLLKGARHSQGGILLEAEDGEAVINRDATAANLPLLDAINRSTGGVGFMERGGVAGGGAIGSTQRSKQVDIVDYDKLATAMSMQRISVSVEEINEVSNRVSVIENDANL